jgi:putative Holliday junction resolvase
MPGMRYLAIDYGTRRTGLAVCDAQETMAFPLDVIQGQKNLIQRIGQIVASEHIDAIVLGLPLNMDGSRGPQARQVLAFAKRLQQHVGVVVHFQDERLSSFGAEEKLQATGLSKAKQRARLDAVAAAEILQAFLEERKGASGGPS